MEISHSNFNVTDLNYGLIEGSQNNMPKTLREPEVSMPQNFLLNTSPIQVQINQTKKKRRNSKRLNAYDSEYLNDMEIESTITAQNTNSVNFFIPSKFDNFKSDCLRTFKGIFEKVPVLNSFMLKEKSKRIKNTVKGLNEINQNVDEMLNGVSPYGEDDKKYSTLAQNLVSASNLIGKVKNDIE